MCKSPDSSSAEDLTDHRDYMPHIICQAFLSTVVPKLGDHESGHVRLTLKCIYLTKVRLRCNIL